MFPRRRLDEPARGGGVNLAAASGSSPRPDQDADPPSALGGELQPARLHPRERLPPAPRTDCRDGGGDAAAAQTFRDRPPLIRQIAGPKQIQTIERNSGADERRRIEFSTR